MKLPVNHKLATSFVALVAVGVMAGAPAPVLAGLRIPFISGKKKLPEAPATPDMPQAPSAAMPRAISGPAADYPVVLGEPYQAGGRLFTPVNSMNYDAVGYASIADQASGVSAAHHTLPLPSYVEVTSLTSGRTILVRVERRGPMDSTHAIELSPAAASQLGLSGSALAVRVRRVNPLEVERAALRSGGTAPERMATPKPLLAVLQRRLANDPAARMAGAMLSSGPVMGQAPSEDEADSEAGSATRSAAKPALAKDAASKAAVAPKLAAKLPPRLASVAPATAPAAPQAATQPQRAPARFGADFAQFAAVTPEAADLEGSEAQGEANGAAYRPAYARPANVAQASAKPAKTPSAAPKLAVAKPAPVKASAKPAAKVPAAVAPKAPAMAMAPVVPNYLIKPLVRPTPMALEARVAQAASGGATGGAMVVQVGAFADRARAAQVANRAGGRVAGANGLFRVRMGPFSSRGEAEAALAKARAAGYSEARIQHND